MLEYTLILVLTAVLMFLGLLGSILPVLPGTPLILLGALVYAWYTGFTVISWMTLLALLALTLLSYFLDVFASALGVKKLGGSRWGMAGALLGAIFGLVFGGLLGLILGPFVGAFLLELAKKKDPAASLRSGVGTLLGFLAGTIGKLILAAVMIGIFVVKLIV
jgi:uncharacterized protein YqgC (DUF456 family)